MIRHLWTQTAQTLRMEISALFLGYIFLRDLNSAADQKDSGKSLEQQAGLREDKTSAETPSVKCQMQGDARLPAFSTGGDFAIVGVFSLYHYKVMVKDNYTAVGG